MLNIGDILGNRYEIEGKIGQGGMSYVYRAKDRTLGRVVAIKVLKEEFSKDEDFIRKFKNEAKAAAKLSHPNIVGAYDVVDEADLHYIVMELVEGITLKNYIARKGRLSNKETIGIALQAAEGIGEAHKKGIVHRDIKPQNMIISKDGRVKVADFGIAKAVTGETINAAVIGSVHYISPEQARSGVADARSDLYSLGISMYEMITGRVPYEGENTVNVVMAHLSEAMVPPSVYAPDIYPALCDIIMKACRKRPEERYQSAAELVADLKRCVRDPEGHFVRYGEAPKKAGEEEGSAGEDRKRKTASETAASESAVSESAAFEKKTGEAVFTRGDAAKAEEQAEDGSLDGARPSGAEAADRGGFEIQRMMRIGSIAAGVIILLVILMVAGSLSGVFRARSLPETEESQSTKEGETSPSEITLTKEKQTGASMMVLMPDLIRMPVSEASAMAASSGLSLDTSKTAFSDVFNEGIVMEQEPAQGEEVEPGETVHVTVSLGNRLSYTLSHLSGQTVEEAEAALSEAGITVAGVNMEASDTVEENHVIAWENAEEGTLSEGGSVRLSVSSGKPAEEVLVPFLHNLTQQGAQSALAAAGLSLGKLSTQSSDIAAGLVIGQLPEAGQSAKLGSAVALVLSSGPAAGAADGNAAAGSGAAAAQEEDGPYYYGSIDTIARAGVASGPDAVGETVNIEIRLMQRGAKSFEYITLGELKAVPAGTEFPVSYQSIQGIYGVTTGEIQVVNADTGETLETFDITFAPR